MLQTAGKANIAQSQTATLLNTNSQSGNILQFTRQSLVASQQQQTQQLNPLLQQELSTVPQQHQPALITHVNSETEKKLKKLQELALNDKEMIELQRKAVYIQKLEFQSLQQKYEALKRNFDALSVQNMNEKSTNDQSLGRIKDLEKERDKLQINVKDLQNKIAQMQLVNIYSRAILTSKQLFFYHSFILYVMNQLGPDFENRKDYEIKELKEQNEAKKEEIYQMKKELIQKQKKIQEIEMRWEQIVREKDREIEEAKNDSINMIQELMKEQILTIKQKDKHIQSLEQQMNSLNSIISEKTEANLTMGEVIARVKVELTQEYEPVIKQLKEENSARDVFYQREMDKQTVKFEESHYEMLAQIKRTEVDIDEWKRRLEDKQKECERYLKTIEEKREQYQELNMRKEEMETNKNNIIDDLEKILSGKESELSEMQGEISLLQRSLLEKQRELEAEKAHNREKVLLLQKQNEIVNDTLMNNQQFNKLMIIQFNSIYSSKQQSQSSLEEKNLELRKQLAEAQSQLRQLNLNHSMLKSEQQNDKRVIQELQQKLESEIENQIQISSQQLKEMRRGHLNDISSLKKVLDKIEIHYIYSECLMLVCGHCICSECISKHSDPKSKDSIVFCEECKIETKNRHLVKSLAIKNINQNFLLSKQMIDSILNSM